MKSEKNKLTDFDFDKRVRERHLASGILDPKTVEKHLAALVDVETNCETIPFEQPALAATDDEQDSE